MIIFIAKEDCKVPRGKINIKNNYLVSNFLQQIEISRPFLRVKYVAEKRARFQFVVEIAHKIILILLSL